MLFASLLWLLSAASLVCGRPLLHKAMAMDANCAMADHAMPDHAPDDGDCDDRPCLADSQPYDLAQLTKSDAPQLLALLAAAFTLILAWPPRLTRTKPPAPPDIKPIPLFQRYCVLRN